jgi:hypothetical protein
MNVRGQVSLMASNTPFLFKKNRGARVSTSMQQSL